MATNVLLEASRVAGLLAGNLGEGRDFVQAATAPVAPQTGDQWLNDSAGPGATGWPLLTFVDGTWVQGASYNPQDDTLTYETDTMPSADGITVSASAPTTVAEGDLWWQPIGNQLVQYCFLNAGWQATGAVFDTVAAKFLPVPLGAGLSYDSSGKITAEVTQADLSGLGSGSSNTGSGWAAGDIVISFDDQIPPTMIELDGSIVFSGVAAYPGIAARYPWMVTGTAINLPDCRGMVLRHLDATRSRDVQSNDRISRVGDQKSGTEVGTYQRDTLGSHSHETAVAYVPPSVKGVVGIDLALGQYNAVDGPINDGTTNSMPTGGFETRMKNIAVRYCMIAG